jgi:hypothetical protein
MLKPLHGSSQKRYGIWYKGAVSAGGYCKYLSGRIVAEPKRIPWSLNMLAVAVRSNQ